MQIQLFRRFVNLRAESSSMHLSTATCSWRFLRTHLPTNCPTHTIPQLLNLHSKCGSILSFVDVSIVFSFSYLMIHQLNYHVILSAGAQCQLNVNNTSLCGCHREIFFKCTKFNFSCCSFVLVFQIFFLTLKLAGMISFCRYRRLKLRWFLWPFPYRLFRSLTQLSP